MRIGLNATCFNSRPSGANQRFRGIYGALIRSAPEHHFIVYEPADCAVGEWFADAPNVETRKTPLQSGKRLQRALRGLAYWPKAMAHDRLDLFETFHLPLVRAPCPTVLTVHDARPVLPEVPLPKRLAFGRIMRSALRRADHVITVSETMKQEILAIAPEARVSSIYNGIDPAPFADLPAAEAEAIRDRLGLPRGFVLAIGHLEKRKNYPRLIEALARLRDNGRAVQLVIVGNDGGDGKVVADAIARFGLTKEVRLLQGVDDKELAGLYALSDLVVFPSSYEGFGIPILEAMAAGRPLLLSDIPVFRELTEGRGHYFPPDDSVALADALNLLLSNGEERQRLIDYGRQRVQAFAFEDLARQVARVHQSLV